MQERKYAAVQPVAFAVCSGTAHAYGHPAPIHRKSIGCTVVWFFLRVVVL
jgi:2-succinyl-5-enolpyruvyl-6-hydroxy-3-cyclohexene-1-carboxylate synthase